MTIWKKLRRMMIVVKFNTVSELKEYREAIKGVGLNVHECSILCIVNSKKENALMRDLGSVVFLSEKEYNLFGGIKNESANKLLAENFDAVVFMGDFSKKIRKSVKKVSPQITVGVNAKKTETDINLQSKSDKPDHLINFVRETLQKIS